MHKFGRIIKIVCNYDLVAILQLQQMRMVMLKMDTKLADSKDIFATGRQDFLPGPGAMSGFNNIEIKYIQFIKLKKKYLILITT